MRTRLLQSLDPAKCVHIAVDWQSSFIWTLGEFAAPLSKSVVTFSQELKQLGIPTVWVAFPLSFYQDHPEKGDAMRSFIGSAAEANDYLCKENKLGLAAPDDCAALKFACDAFSNLTLAPFLESDLGRTTALVSGVYLGACVDDTMRGALKQPEFSCVAVTDLIAPAIVALDHSTGDTMRRTGIPKGDRARLTKLVDAHYKNRRGLEGFPAECFAPATSDEVVNRLRGAAQASRPYAAPCFSPAPVCVAA